MFNRDPIETKHSLWNLKRQLRRMDQPDNSFFMIVMPGGFHIAKLAIDYFPSNRNLVVIGNGVDREEVKWAERDLPVSAVLRTRVMFRHHFVLNAIFASWDSNFGIVDYYCFVLEDGLLDRMRVIDDGSVMNAAFFRDNENPELRVAQTVFLFFNIQVMRTLMERYGVSTRIIRWSMLSPEARQRLVTIGISEAKLPETHKPYFDTLRLLMMLGLSDGKPSRFVAEIPASPTECNADQLEFHALGRRGVVGDFDGGMISSDGGGLLLGEVEARTKIIERLGEQFVDYRDAEAIEHTVKDLVGQRVFAQALGYEDLNDHDRLRLDPLLALLVGKEDPTGQDRLSERDKGKALASSSTLNRLELTPADADAKARYKKIVANSEGMDRLLVEIFLEAHEKPPEEIWIDLDATDDPTHGQQEGRFFHGYYGHYCYLPLYIFSGEHLLCARLRPSNIDASAGSVEELDWIVGQIRACWPETKIIVRGDSGFCREAIMVWCEAHRVDFVLGLAKNDRLLALSLDARIQAQLAYLNSGESSRVFCEFDYQTRDSWSRQRRVIAKAEHLTKGANPRFVVTSLSTEQADARTLYEDLYCARGDMENRIKEQPLDLFADRTSTQTMRANQIRLYFASFAYVLLCALRREGLEGTEFERAQCGTIRVKLLKIGAQLRVSVRRIRISFSESYPYADLFRQILHNLRAPPLGAGAT